MSEQGLQSHHEDANGTADPTTAEQSLSLAPSLPQYTLFVSNLPYSVHASTIQDMLDHEQLQYVRPFFFRALTDSPLAIKLQVACGSNRH